jgi:hypothetical protein
MELIINLIGTPPIEDIYQISTTKSREIVFKLGKIEPKNLAEIFPSANLDGILIYLYNSC